MQLGQEAVSATRDILSATQDSLNSLKEGLFTVGKALQNVSKLSFQFTKNSVRAHYNLAGQYTAPLEQEIYHTEPPKPSDLNSIGQIALGLTGVIPLTWLASVTVMPFVTNSLQSFAKSFIYTFDFTDGSKLQERSIFGVMTNDDQRSVGRKSLYGGLGYFTGFSLGGVLSIYTNSYNTAARVTASMTNLLMHPDDKSYVGTLGYHDERHFFRKYVLGSPGIVLGGITGLMSMVVVAGVRTVTNSAQTLLRTVVTCANFSLHKDEQINEFKGLEEEDPRHFFRRYIVGFPGLIMGTLVGGVAILAIGLGRIITNNAKTYLRTFASYTKLALAPSDSLPLLELEEYDARSKFRKYIVGFPGLLLGSIVGIASALVVSVGRIITNSAKTMLRTLVTCSNVALHRKEQITSLSGLWQNERRSFVRAYIVGFPGLVLGGIFGAVAIGFIGLGRMFSNSSKTLKRTLVTFIKAVLHPNDSNHIQSHGLEQNDPRHWFRKYAIGFPGLLLGGIIGPVASVTILIGRFITNNIKTMCRAFLTFTNACLYNDPNNPNSDDRIFPNYSLEKNDNRSLLRKYVVGLPGLVLGSIAGVISAAVVLIGRLVTNSFNTGVRTIVSLTNLILLPHERSQFDGLETNDPRSLIRKYIVGFPGLVLGGIFGPGVMLFAILDLALKNSFDTTVRTFVTIANKALHISDKIKENGLEQNDARTFGRKYVLGFPGLVLGGAFGVVGFSIAAVGRFISQTFKSWRALSGSFMNGAIEQACFCGLGGDTRLPVEKTVGGLGYLLAMATTLPVSVGVFAIRKLPILASVSLGFVCSPLVATGKVISKMYEHLVQHNNNQDAIITALANLEGSLSTFGKLESGKDLGPKHLEVLRFVRKCLTFNSRTITERIIEAIKHSYKGEGQEYFSSEAFSNAIQEISTFYENDCFASVESLREINQEIQNVANFIKNYCDNKISKIPSDLYVKNKQEWTATFWGAPKAQGQDLNASQKDFKEQLQCQP